MEENIEVITPTTILMEAIRNDDQEKFDQYFPFIDESIDINKVVGSDDVEMEEVVGDSESGFLWDGYQSTGGDKSIQREVLSHTGNWGFIEDDDTPLTRDELINDHDYWVRHLSELLEFQQTVEKGGKKAGYLRFWMGLGTLLTGATAAVTLGLGLALDSWLAWGFHIPLDVLCGASTYGFIKAWGRVGNVDKDQRQQFINFRRYMELLVEDFQQYRTRPVGQAQYVIIDGKSCGPYPVDYEHDLHDEREKTLESNFLKCPDSREVILEILPVWIGNARKKIREHKEEIDKTEPRVIISGLRKENEVHKTMQVEKNPIAKTLGDSMSKNVLRFEDDDRNGEESTGYSSALNLTMRFYQTSETNNNNNSNESNTGDNNNNTVWNGSQWIPQ